MKPALVRWMPDVFGAEGALGPAGVHMAAASMAEVAACLIRVPTEVIKSRQQTMTYGRAPPRCRHSKRCSRKRACGLLPRLRQHRRPRDPVHLHPVSAVRAAQARNGTSRASKDAASGSGVASEERVHALSDQELVRGLPTWQAGLAGSIAGAIAAGLTTPLDVVKTRIMLHTKRSASAHPGGAAAAAASAAESLPRRQHGHHPDAAPHRPHRGYQDALQRLPPAHNVDRPRRRRLPGHVRRRHQDAFLSASTRRHKPLSLWNVSYTAQRNATRALERIYIEFEGCGSSGGRC